MTADASFQGWAILELMGHRRVYGHVQEVTLAGAGFLRVDVYEGEAEAAKVTQFYPPSSVYCLTPTTEAAAREAARPYAPPTPALPSGPMFDDDEDLDKTHPQCERCESRLCGGCEAEPW